MTKERDEYIHIHEAVKVYDKTRQTFYNYINKGLVNSKKVHNKLYLKIDDIEKVLGNYLSEDDLMYDYDDQNNTYTFTGNQDTYFGSLEQFSASLELLQKEFESFKQTTPEHISQIEDSLHLEMKTVSERCHEQLEMFEHGFGNRLNSLGEQIIASSQRQKLQQKKLYFVIGYMLFLVLNSSIVSFLVLL